MIKSCTITNIRTQHNCKKAIAMKAPKPNDEMSPILLAYIRVSTTQQGDGVSLEAQKAAIIHLGQSPAYEGFQPVFIEEVGSAAPGKERKGFNRALSTLRRGDTLACYSLSRISRSTKEMMDISDLLTQRGIELVSITEGIDTNTAAGKMMFRMLAVLAEFERDLTAERTSSALQKKKADGKVYGKVPYGKRRVGDDLVDDEQEQANIRVMQVLRDAGYSYHGIAEHMQQNRAVTRTPLGSWHRSGVRLILNRVSAEGKYDGGL